MTLDADDIESIATRVAELLREQMASSEVRLVDATGVARELGVDREWVYAHADELGGTRLGGEHGRLRFDLAKIRRELACPADNRNRPAAAGRRRQPATRRRGGVELIPYSEVRSTGQAQSGRATRQRPRPDNGR
jgi:hypothetical protein